MHIEVNSPLYQSWKHLKTGRVTITIWMLDNQIPDSYEYLTLKPMGVQVFEWSFNLAYYFFGPSYPPSWASLSSFAMWRLPSLLSGSAPAIIYTLCCRLWQEPGAQCCSLSSDTANLPATKAGFGWQFKFKPFLTKNRPFSVQLSYHHLNTGPFDNRTQIISFEYWTIWQPDTDRTIWIPNEDHFLVCISGWASDC